MKREDKLAQEYFSNNIYCQGITPFEEMIAKRCYKAGYLDAQPKQFTEEDLRKVWEACSKKERAWLDSDTQDSIPDLEQTIASIKQPLEIEVTYPPLCCVSNVKVITFTYRTEENNKQLKIFKIPIND